MKKVKIVKINVEINMSKEIAASIEPILRKDGSVDEAALGEYQEFLINVLSVLDENEYEVLEDRHSNQSDTSYCITAYKKSESTAQDIKCIIFIRISDHALSSYAQNNISNYHKREAERLKQPVSKTKQTWRFKNIIVNGDIFDSYDAALDEISRKLK